MKTAEEAVAERGEGGGLPFSTASDPLARFAMQRLGLSWAAFALMTWFLYGPIEKLLIPWLGGYLRLEGSAYSWIPDLEALLTGFFEFPFFFGFYLWCGGAIDEAFLGPARNRCFRDAGAYQCLLGEIQKAFYTRHWSIIGLVVAELAILWWHFFMWGPGTELSPWFERTLEGGIVPRPNHRFLALGMIGAVAYVLSQIVIRELVALVWTCRLWKRMGDDLFLHPYHSDAAGGLGALGRHGIGVAYFLIVLFLFLGMGTLLPKVRGGGPIQWNPVLVSAWFLYVVAVPVGLGLFLVPPHQAMKRARAGELDRISRELDRLHERLRATVDRGEEVKELVEAVEALRKARASVLADFGVWPFAPEIRKQIGASTMFPLAQLVVTWAQDHLATLLARR